MMNRTTFVFSISFLLYLSLVQILRRLWSTKSGRGLPLLLQAKQEAEGLFCNVAVYLP